MDVMLSLSLRLDLALESGTRNQDATAPAASTAPRTSNFIDLSPDEVSNNKGKGKEREVIISDSAGPPIVALGLANEKVDA